MPRHLVRLLAISASAALCIPLFGSSSSPRSPEEPLRRSGVLTSWRVDADGTVYLRLDGVSDRSEFLWFASPPDRDSQSRFESMLVDVALAFENRELTVLSKAERSLDGQSPDQALPLEAVVRE